MRLVVINNLHWAIGFVWPLDASWKSSRSRTRAVLRKKAHEIDPAFDTVTFRPQQYGFCVGAGRDISKVRSLAGFLTLSSTSFLGIFRLDDVSGEAVWWLFCRRHGRNIGMGDTVYATRAEAEEEAKSLRALLKDDFVDNKICATSAESVALLSTLLKPNVFDAIRGTARLESLSKPPSRPLVPVLAACLALWAVVWGITQYIEHQSVQAALEAAHRDRFKAEQRRREIQARPELHFSQEWMTKPRPDAFMARCATAMSSRPMFAGGWQLDSLTCSESNLDLTWRHQPGADYLTPPERAAIHEEDPLLATATFPLSALSVQRDGQAFPAILTKEQAARELYHLCQLIGVQLRQNLHFSKPADREIDRVKVVAPWVRADFELVDVPLLLLGDPDFARILSDIPGLILESIEYKNSLVWKGYLYARTR